MARPRHPFSSPSFWPLQIAGWTTYFVMIVATFWPMMAPGRPVLGLVQLKLVRALIGFALTCGMRLVLRRYATGQASVARAALVVLGSVAVAGPLWLLLMNVVFPPATPAVVHGVAIGWIPAPREALDYSLTLLCWSALYLALRGWRELQDQRARALEATSLAQQAQLDALRYQLNPHFLFNGLNSIRALVDEDAARARRMITALSEFLRYPLTSAAGADVALATELDAMRNYLAIEQIRFEERLRVTIDVTPEAETAAIPSFLLHPLVENAITHGFATAADTLSLIVTARVRDDGRVWLEVSNTGRWRATHETADRQGTGTGLRNVQLRLAALAPGTHDFSVTEEGSNVIVRVALPYRAMHAAAAAQPGRSTLDDAARPAQADAPDAPGAPVSGARRV